MQGASTDRGDAMLRRLLPSSARDRLLLAAGLLLGWGLGGLLAMTVGHQLDRWWTQLGGEPRRFSYEHLLLTVITRQDALFQAGMWVIIAAGLWLLYRAGLHDRLPRSPRLFGGALLAGAGAFCLVEGAVLHHVLARHHLLAGAQQRAWDIGYLVAGLVLLALGLYALRPVLSRPA
jgi:uncharacterized membrane protein